MRRAFTLIELLIVVAIIAILAAIAVPNFLEAQVRAKVSRAKTDMRTMTTAIEAYYVDYNRYPPAAQYSTMAGGNFNSRIRGLTTPVSYLSSVPPDVFREKVAGGGPITAGIQLTYEYEDYAAAVHWGLISQRPYRNLPDFNLFASQNAYDLYFTGRRGVNLKWSLLSVGPDRKSDFEQTPVPIAEANALLLGNRNLYDPTNGTVSRGDIIRTSIEQK